MQIQGPANLHGAQPVNGPQKLHGPAASQATDSLHQSDQVDISPEADLVSQVAETADVRTDRIAEIRQQIAAGTYETPEKLEVALGRLMDNLSW